MSSNLGAGLSAAVDEMHAESDVQAPEVDETPKPKAKTPAPKKAATPPKRVGKQQTAPEAGAAEESDDNVVLDEGGEEETPAAAKSNPWDSDLDARGINTPEVQQYMSEVVQPYITRLEQQGTPFASLFEGNIEAAQVAAGVLQELDQDPGAAIAKLISVFAEDDESIYDAINQALGVEGGEEVPGQPAPAGQPGEESNPLLDALRNTPEWQHLTSQVEQTQAQKEAQDWEAYVTEVKAVIPDLDEDLFTLATAAAGDDPEMALTYYNSYRSKQSNAGAPPAKPQAPPTMGAGQGRPAPQPAKEYTGKTGIRDAIGDFMETDKVQRGKR